MFALTTEACLKKIDNVYSLVYLAAKRTVGLNRGEKSLLPDLGGEKPIMVAVEEISTGMIALAPPEENNEPDES
jgi:DNA-directed RNA polymerase omega subunit